MPDDKPRSADFIAGLMRASDLCAAAIADARQLLDKANSSGPSCSWAYHDGRESGLRDFYKILDREIGGRREDVC